MKTCLLCSLSNSSSFWQLAFKWPTSDSGNSWLPGHWSLTRLPPWSSHRPPANAPGACGQSGRLPRTSPVWVDGWAAQGSVFCIYPRRRPLWSSRRPSASPCASHGWTPCRGGKGSELGHVHIFSLSMLTAGKNKRKIFWLVQMGQKHCFLNIYIFI